MTTLRRLPLFILLLASTGFAPLALRSAPVDLSPPRNALGAADENGYFRYVHRFGDLRFSDNFSIPLRFDFSSRRVVDGKKSDFGWHGWQCGAIESEANFLEDGRILRIDLLCAKVMFLERVKGETGRYLTTDGAWTGIVEGDEIRIERKDGWSLRFVGGKVSSFRTEKSKMIRWERDAENRVLRVVEEGADEPALIVKWDGGRAVGLDLGEVRYELDYEDDSLAAFRWKSLDGIERFFLAKQAPDSLAIETSRVYRYRFQWHAETGIVVAEGGDRYATKREQGSGRTVLTLTGADGAVTSYELGTPTGETRQTYPGGGEIVVTRVASQGRDNGAVAKVEWVREGEAPLALLSNVFDEQGRIVRRLWHGDPIDGRDYGDGSIEPALLPDREGVHPASDIAKEDALSMIEYTFTEDDQLREVKVNRKPVLTLAYDETKRPLSLHRHGHFEKTFTYRDDGAVTETLALVAMEKGPFWYLESGDSSVGPDLVISSTEDAGGRLLERTHADGRRLVVTYDAGQRRVGDETYARDGSTLISSVTYVHSPADGTVLRIAEDHLSGKIEHSEITPAVIGLDFPGRRIPREVAASTVPN